MKHNREKSGVILLSCLVIVAVIGMLILLYVTTRPDPSSTIILPEPEEQTTLQPPPPMSEEDTFLQVTTENVQQIVAGLARPGSYHQICSVTVMSGDIAHTNQVELWVNGPLLRAVITGPGQTKHVLTDRVNAYVWYEEDDTPIRLNLSENISTDDLLGLPTYETLLQTDSGSITDAEYLMLETTSSRCIYVCAEAGPDVTERYWIDLDTGLLAKSDVLEHSQQVYLVQQDMLELLASQDEVFQTWFQLPDGTMPFTVRRAAPQP